MKSGRAIVPFRNFQGMAKRLVQRATRPVLSCCQRLPLYRYYRQTNKQETFLKWLTKLSKDHRSITDNLYWHCSLMKKHSLHCSRRIQCFRKDTATNSKRLKHSQTPSSDVVVTPLQHAIYTHSYRSVHTP